MTMDRQQFLERNKDATKLQLKRQKRPKSLRTIGKWLKPRRNGS